MSYEPDAMIEEAGRQRVQVVAMVAPLDEATFTREPAPGRWSVAECLEHLALLNAIYLDAIDAAARRGREAGLLAPKVKSKRKKRHGWLGDLFVRSLEPPPRTKGGAFERTVPAGQPREAVLPQFLGAQDRLIRAIEATRDLDLARVRMRSPFFRPLRLSLGQAFGAMLAHNRRHIWQAEGAIEAIRSPAAVPR